MASSEYYRRQADTLLTLALTAIDPELSARYRNLAIRYKKLAENAGKNAAPPGSASERLSIAAGASNPD